MTHLNPSCPTSTHETGVNNGIGRICKRANTGHTFFLSISQEQKLNILN